MKRMATPQEGFVSAGTTLDRFRKLEGSRHRGYLGTIIHSHRALRSSPSFGRKVLPSLLLTLVFLFIWYLVQEDVARFWGEVMEFWRKALGIGGDSSMIR